MAALNPNQTTVYDLCLQALKDAGVIGVGQSPHAEDLSEAQMRLQWMLQQWQNKRWLNYDLVTYVIVSAGKAAYTVGPSGGPGTAPDIAIGTYGLAARPNRIESAFFRQLIGGPYGPVDYPLSIIESMEGYNRIAVKGLSTFASACFYDPAWVNTAGMGMLYVWPVPLANIFSIGITVRSTLPAAFSNQNSIVDLPFEYFQAIVSNLALALRPKYGLGTYQGDNVPRMAKDGLATIRASNTAISELQVPADLVNRGGGYNIFTDR